MELTTIVEELNMREPSVYRKQKYYFQIFTSFRSSAVDLWKVRLCVDGVWFLLNAKVAAHQKTSKL